MRNKELSKKSIALILALAMVVGSVVGGTIAWLTAKTAEVKNVFTTGGIDIELKEHRYNPDNDILTDEETTKGVDNYKMIPGWVIPKDPWVEVEENSEDCYVFIKVEETGVSFVPEGETMPMVYSFDDYLVYKIAEEWEKLEGEEGVYYKVIEGANAKGDENHHEILVQGRYTDPMGDPDSSDDDVTVSWSDKHVAVKPSVTEEMMEVVTEENYPTLSFTAYAVQLRKDNTTKFEPAEAWSQVKPVNEID